jgi:lipid-binding SYLF domain-containing protein
MHFNSRLFASAPALTVTRFRQRSRRPVTRSGDRNRTGRTRNGHHREPWPQQTLHSPERGHHAFAGVLIFPHPFSAGFVIAGARGSGVPPVRDAATGHWVGPAFYSLTQASVGLQAGASTSEYIIVVHSQKALETLFKTGLKLGMDTSPAVGPVGSGGGAAMTTDVDVFSRVKGLFVGIALDGAALHIRMPLAAAYYGKPATPSEILVERTISNPAADALRIAVEAAATQSVAWIRPASTHKEVPLQTAALAGINP